MKKTRGWYPLIFSLPLLVLLLFGAITGSGSSYEESTQLTKIRMIGHRVLLTAGDSVSRVMPIEELDQKGYKIRFEKTFVPVVDSLILVSREYLKGQGSYTIEVWETKTRKMVYSFFVSNDNRQTLIPCLNRPLPPNNYDVVIQFADKNTSAGYMYGACILLLAIGVGWYIYSMRSPKKPVTPGNELTGIAIGAMQFFPDLQKIVMDNKQVELTAKECQVLSLLAETPNTVVERSRLQKEIWEDQGVIVTRSLDIFVSRLRKKLSLDPNVKIVNVHSRGYKLEIITTTNEQ